MLLRQCLLVSSRCQVSSAGHSVTDSCRSIDCIAVAFLWLSTCLRLETCFTDLGFTKCATLMSCGGDQFDFPLPTCTAVCCSMQCWLAYIIFWSAVDILYYVTCEFYCTNWTIFRCYVCIRYVMMFSCLSVRSA